MKKVLLLMTVLITSVLVISGVKADTSSDITAARQNGTNLKDYSGVKVDKKLPAEYSFVLGKNNNLKVTYSGGVTVPQSVIDAWGTMWTESGLNLGQASLANDSIKGNFSALYKNVSVYNNQIVDVKATIMDFDLQTGNGIPASQAITLKNDNIGINVAGVKWVKVKYEFFKSGTNTPISVKGNTSYWDIDEMQGIIMHNSNKGFYVANNTILKITNINGASLVYDDSGNSDSDENTQYGFTEIFEGSTMTRTFTFGYPGYSSLTDAINKQNYDASIWGGRARGGIHHTSEPLVPVSPANPTKAVDKERVTIGEEYTYTINETVPQMLEQYYYKTFALEDVLEDCLKVDTSKVTVKNENGEDVTSWFTITNEGQKITAQLKEANNKASFYGHTYTFSIKTSIKANMDLSKWKKVNDYIIPNQAKIKITDYNNEESDQPTEIVNVIYTPEVIDNVPSTSAALPLYISIIGVLLVVIATAGIIYTNRKKENK